MIKPPQMIQTGAPKALSFGSGIRNVLLAVLRGNRRAGVGHSGRLTYPASPSQALKPQRGRQR